jgi:predicted nucleic acid-binding protein
LSVLFADTSAIAKRYLMEIGSVWVRQWANPAAGNIVIISRLATVEVATAVARREREGTISPNDAATLRRVFTGHVNNAYAVINLSKDVLAQACDLVGKYPLRSLDAIQLASALRAAQTLGVTPTFISADMRLLSAATAEGFAVDDPNAHP